MMLKSTYKRVGGLVPLPPEWTEHKAPTGHTYYYNADTKQSTYTRPSVPALYGAQQGLPSITNGSIGVLGAKGPFGLNSGYPISGNSGPQHHQIDSGFHGRGGSGVGRDFEQRRRPPPNDRPKSKHAIPGCEPWLLVYTKLKRRFVHNTETGESFWKFPQNVMLAVIEFDRIEREKKDRVERGEEGYQEEEAKEKTPDMERAAATAQPMPATRPAEAARRESDDEYEEVEVTDDEDEDNPPKRQKTENDKEDGPVEFNEDDIAYQLAAMGEDYGLDPGEYGDGQGEEWEEGAEGLPLTEEDSNALFKDLLNDYHVNPYTPWEKIIEDGQIVDDDRYTCLTTMKARRDVWAEWSKESIQFLKDQKERQEKKDPRIPYFAFMQEYATPKLYWPEFRRKYRKEAPLRDTKISDKDREKWYREYINHLKLSESTLKSDLTTLLKSLPLQSLNRSTSMEALPPALLTDVRYISLQPLQRDPLIETYISILPAAPEPSKISPEEEAEMAKQRADRERWEKALVERERRVQEEKRKQQGALNLSKGMLREGEEEIRRAMRVGKEGLFGHLSAEERPQAPPNGDGD